MRGSSSGGGKKPVAKAWGGGEVAASKSKTSTGKPQRARPGAADSNEGEQVQDRSGRDSAAWRAPATANVSAVASGRTSPTPRAKTPTKKKTLLPQRTSTPAATLRSNRSGELTASSSRSGRPSEGGGSAEADTGRRRLLAPTPTAEIPRRARTAESGSDSFKTQSRASTAGRLSPTATRSATRRLPQSAGRNMDMSDAVAENQKQVTDILDLIASKDADSTVVVRTSVLSARFECSNVVNDAPLEKLIVATPARDSVSAASDRRVRPPTGGRAIAAADH